MTNNLTPKVITDKNGVTTTRWVKPETSITSPALLPPPVIVDPAPEDEEQDWFELVTSVYNMFTIHPDVEIDDLEDASKALDELSTDTLLMICNYMGGGEETLDPEKVYTSAVWVAKTGNQETYLRELITYVDCFSETTSLGFIEVAVSRLRYCAELPQLDDYSKADDATREAIQGIITSAELAYDTEPDAPEQRIILSPNMRQLIQDNPEQLDRIKDIMDERDTEDYLLVQSILEADSKALSSGTL